MQSSSAKLYMLDLRPFFTAHRWRSFLPLLPERRAHRALACRSEEDSARLAGVGWLLQQALILSGIPAERQIFSENAWGKPFLPGGPSFSLSHAGPYALCAVAPLPVGVDVEAPRCTMELAVRCFHPNEIAFLQTLASDAQQDTLCRLWTAKEAYTKMLGLGLHLPLRSFWVDLSGKSAVLHDKNVPSGCCLHEYRLDDGFRLCLCAVSARPDLKFLVPDFSSI